MTSDVPAAPPAQTVMHMALGYLMSRSLHVATELGVADHLDNGPRALAELATRIGAHGPSLRRLLRALAAQGIFREDSEDRFANTPASDLLRQGVMRDGVLLCGEVAGDGSWWRAAGALRESVLSGRPAFEGEHGTSFFSYVQQRPDCGRWFDRGMANFASAEDPAIAAALPAAGLRHLVDVGGGRGGLLAQLLQRNPALHGTLFDQAQVVADATALSGPEWAGRCSSVAGDFFLAVPKGADAYVLKRILHDWSDEDCVRILRRCREAMDHRSRLFVAEAVLPPGNAAHPGKVMDMLMMIFAGGRERGAAEFEALLRQAGLRLVGIQPTASTLSLIEAQPA